MITIQHINTTRTDACVRMLTIDGNGVRKAYQVSPEIEDQALTELHSDLPRPASLTIEVQDDQVVNYYR